MVTTKRCAWGTCRNDTRYPQRIKRNSKGDEVSFLHFPGAKYHNTKRERWIRACNRHDDFNCTNHSYICSLHFVGGNGPTYQHPDPIQAVECRARRIYVSYESMKLIIIVITKTSSTPVSALIN